MATVTMRQLPLDAYVIDVLMRDLVGHDRAPSAFVVYLWLYAKTHAEGKTTVGASLQTIASETGLSKSSVQNAVSRLSRRRFVTAHRIEPTAAPIYEVHRPWRRD